MPFVLACLLGPLHGCVAGGERIAGAPPSVPADPESGRSVEEGAERDAELLARDFANTIGQLPGTDPARVRLMFAPDGAVPDPMLAALLRRLASAGFGVPADPARTDVSVDRRRTSLPDEGEAAWRVELAVGPVSLRRDYRDTVDGPRPLTPMLVRGADAAALRAIDDELFGPASRDTVPDIGPGIEPDIGPDTVPGIGPDPGTEAGVDTGDEPDPDVLVLSSSLPVRLPSGPRVTGPVPGEPVVAMQRTVDFARGSASLSRADVGRVDEILASYRSDAHLVAVFGTSLGTAAAAPDNRAMALVRASRIKRALVAGGVPAERVLLSGLWLADEAPAGLPRRGALIQLRRGAP